MDYVSLYWDSVWFYKVQPYSSSIAIEIRTLYWRFFVTAKTAASIRKQLQHLLKTCMIATCDDPRNSSIP